MNTIIVDKIYLTRGKNCFDEKGRRADRIVGLKTNFGIFWIDKAFATIGELSLTVDWKLFNICLLPYAANGKWGQIDSNGKMLPKNFTRLHKNHAEIFAEESMYVKKAVFNGERIFWHDHELAKFVEENGLSFALP